jgi:hypothetical protein
MRKFGVSLLFAWLLALASQWALAAATEKEQTVEPVMAQWERQMPSGTIKWICGVP